MVEYFCDCCGESMPNFSPSSDGGTYLKDGLKAERYHEIRVFADGCLCRKCIVAALTENLT